MLSTRRCVKGHNEAFGSQPSRGRPVFMVSINRVSPSTDSFQRAVVCQLIHHVERRGSRTSCGSKGMDAFHKVFQTHSFNQWLMTGCAPRRCTQNPSYTIREIGLKGQTLKKLPIHRFRVRIAIARVRYCSARGSRRFFCLPIDR